ncbi:MAG: hypothetical protein IJV96_00360 [Clostridia bacterium]|nr:hypothetical protein [Clostridia bacterium]
MKNIFLVFSVTFVCYAVFIGIIVHDVIKKPKFYVLRILFLIGLIVLLTILEIPIYKDMFLQKTHTVVAEYVSYQSSNTLPATQKAFFEGEGGRLYVYIPIYTRDITNLEAGKVYEVEYFYNSHIIKEYKLLE